MPSIPATQIVWPVDVRHDGFCYGWSHPLLCVAGVLAIESREDAENLLLSYCNSEDWGKLRQICGDPVILGRCTFVPVSRALPSPSLDLYYPETRHPNRGCTFIYYRRPTSGSLHYYTLDVAETSNPNDDYSTAQNAGAVYPNSALPTPSTNRVLDQTVINQLNYAHTVEVNLKSAISPRHSQGSYGSSANLTLFIKRTKYLLGECIAFLYYTSFLITRLWRICLKLLSTPLLAKTWGYLRQMSMTIQQCDTRAEQFAALPRQFQLLRARTGITIQVYCAQYIAFYSFVWLVLNDAIVGAAFGTFICENDVAIAGLVEHFVRDTLILTLQHILIWLDNWPAGLKLNTELSSFYCSTFIGIVGLWGRVLEYIIPYLPTIVNVVGIMGWCGITMVVSALLDLLNIFTAHLYVCYLIGTAVYWQQLRTIRSLWNLFRGKRYNVLRDRIDTWNYEIDQLLLGTILFTLVAFLFPTVLTYYVLFALLEVCVIFVRASLETFLVFMNHFPLFALMLRVKDSWRLSSGIYFLMDATSTLSPPTMEIRHQPVPFFSVFSHFIGIWARISSHYNPLRLLRCLVTGAYLTSIPGYSIRHRILLNPTSELDGSGEH